MGLIYLAHPIDLRKDRHDAIIPAGMFEGHTVYDPAQAFREGGDVKAIARGNRAMLSVSDGLFAVVPPDVATIGVALEIERAYLAYKPVAVVTESPAIALADMQGVMVFHPNYIKQAADWLMVKIEKLAVQPNEVWPESAAKQWTLKSLPYSITKPILKVLPWSDGDLPAKSYEGDAGYDIATLIDAEVPPKSSLDIELDCAIELPSGYWARIVGRSSTFRKRNLQVQEGIIDQGYRGKLFVLVHNFTDEPIAVRKGERLCQLIMHPIVTATVQRVHALSSSERGEKGFGSSGA